MLYRLIRKLFKIAIAIFFKKIVVSGKKNIPVSGPVIVVSNHPNTFLDPLLVATVMKCRIGFVANASIYSVKFLTPIFDYFHVLPIYRQKDVAAGETPDNSKAFAKCHAYLSQGKTLLIFPEGSSYHELKLREIKTGTARIALSFENLSDFGAELKILPVTLDYSDSLQFQSMISIIINRAISVDEYVGKFYANENDCVEELTEEIRKSLARNIPQTTGKAQEEYLIKAHKFYTTYAEPEADLHINPKHSLELRSQLSKALKHISTSNEELYSGLQKGIFNYFEEIRSQKLTSGFFTEEFQSKNRFLVISGYILSFLIMIPIYFVGLITNYLPYILPAKIFKVLKMEIEYKSSVQLVLGIFTFPLFYFLNIYFFRSYISTESFHTLLMLVVMPLCGYFAMYYWTELKRFFRVVRFYFFMEKEKNKEILILRDEILKKIEEARSNL